MNKSRLDQGSGTTRRVGWYFVCPDGTPYGSNVLVEEFTPDDVKGVLKAQAVQACQVVDKLVEEGKWKDS